MTTTTAFYSLAEIDHQISVATHAGATVKKYVAFAMPSAASIAEGCDAVDRQRLIAILHPDGFSVIYFEVGLAGWAKEATVDTVEEFCDREYASDDWAFYLLSEVVSFEQDI
jgi:hypothetical protein